MKLNLFIILIISIFLSSCSNKNIDNNNLLIKNIDNNDNKNIEDIYIDPLKRINNEILKNINKEALENNLLQPKLQTKKESNKKTNISKSSNFKYKSELFLTFDDFPCQREKDISKQTQINKSILETLEKHNAKCIVFANASGMINNIEKYNEMMDLWLNLGHEFGNHTFSHLSLSKTDIFDYKIDIMKGEPILQNVLLKYNQKLVYFRYPYLDYGTPLQKEEIKKFLKDRDYKIVGITIDTLDWKYNSKLYGNDQDSIPNYIEHVKSELKNNFGKRKKDIILFHINLINSKCLDELIKYAKEIGYKINNNILDEF